MTDKELLNTLTRIHRALGESKRNSCGGRPYEMLDDLMRYIREILDAIVIYGTGEEEEGAE